jgi:hypothetical protein
MSNPCHGANCVIIVNKGGRKLEFCGHTSLSGLDMASHRAAVIHITVGDKRSDVVAYIIITKGGLTTKLKAG